MLRYQGGVGYAHVTGPLGTEYRILHRWQGFLDYSRKEHNNNNKERYQGELLESFSLYMSVYVCMRSEFFFDNLYSLQGPYVWYP